MGEAAKKRAARSHEFQSIDRLLRDDGIDTSLIEFYNQTPFLEQEKTDPRYARHLSRWLSRRPMSDSYRSRVSRVVPAVAERAATLFEESDMVASCVNGSFMLSKVLERAGIWNHVIHGSVVMEVASQGIWRGFHTADDKDFPDAFLGHAWVFAPPYHVVDVTIAKQRWDDEERPFVPAHIISRFTSRLDVQLNDVVATRLYPRLNDHPSWGKRQLIYDLLPELHEMEGDIAPMGVAVEETKIRYIPVSIIIPEGPLEQANSAPGCTGPTGEELWGDCADLVQSLAED